MIISKCLKANVLSAGAILSATPELRVHAESVIAFSSWFRDLCNPNFETLVNVENRTKTLCYLF